MANSQSHVRYCITIRIEWINECNMDYRFALQQALDEKYVYRFFMEFRHLIYCCQWSMNLSAIWIANVKSNALRSGILTCYKIEPLNVLHCAVYAFTWCMQHAMTYTEYTYQCSLQLAKLVMQSIGCRSVCTSRK